MTDQPASPRWTRFIMRVVMVVGPIAFVVTTGRSAFEAGDAAHSEASLGGRPILRPAVTLSARPGETLEAFLRRGGLSAAEARWVSEMTRPYAGRRPRVRATEARFHRWPGDAPERIELRVDADQTLVFEVEGAVWTVAVDSVPVRHDTVVVSGRVESSLWGARLAGDARRLSVKEKAALPGHLADVFAWQVDFYRDVRIADQFRLAIERDVRPDGSVRGQRVLAAEWRSGETYLQAYRFSPSDEPGSFFYDSDGTALRGAFLRAPLDLVRITSRFSSVRAHPVLSRYRAHRGIDYGASSGTVVRVTGDGTIARAGWADGYGLLVEVDHSGGIRTRYAHLSGVAAGVHPGAHVSQGARIGAVGSTGLVTGPHLHYEFLVNGRPVDPASVDLPVERPLPAEDVERFARHRVAAARLLRGARWLVAATGHPVRSALPDRAPRAP